MYRFAHAGAVCLHLGRSYRVERFDLEARSVLAQDVESMAVTPRVPNAAVVR